MMRALPIVGSSAPVFLGTLVLIGWAFGLERLKRIVPGFVAMNPATAVLFILAGISFGMTVGLSGSKFARVTAKALAGIVTIAAGVELIELTGLWRSPID